MQEVDKNYSRQLPTNQSLNKLCNQLMRIQQRDNAEERVESAACLECENKQIEARRLQISREGNATRNLTKASKNSKIEQIVRTREENLKTPPLQSTVSSTEESSSASQINPGVKFVKVKTYNEFTDGLLMANYQVDLRLQNVREAVLRRDIIFLSRDKNCTVMCLKICV